MACSVSDVAHEAAAASQGYGLAWSPFLEGNLLSGSDDAQICLWDIAASKGAARMEAKSIYHEHAGVVEVLRVQGVGHRASYKRLALQLVAQAQGSEDGLDDGWGTAVSNTVLSPNGVKRNLEAWRCDSFCTGLA